MARYMRKIGTPHIYPWTLQLSKKAGFEEIPDPFVPTPVVIEPEPVEVVEETPEPPVQKIVPKRPESKQAQATRRRG